VLPDECGSDDGLRYTRGVKVNLRPDSACSQLRLTDSSPILILTNPHREDQLPGIERSPEVAWTTKQGANPHFRDLARRYNHNGGHMTSVTLSRYVFNIWKILILT